MPSEDLEKRIAERPWPSPPPQVRRALMARAAGRLQQRVRRTQRWRWSLVAVGSLLVVVNMGFEVHHSRRMSELLGPAPPIAGVAVAPESWRLQREMMAELLGEVNPPERRPGHEHGPLSDFPAAGALVA